MWETRLQSLGWKDPLEKEMETHSSTLAWKILWKEETGRLQFSVQFSSIQSLSHVRLFATQWIAVHQASLSISISWSSLKLTSIEAMMPSSHLILCRPLLLLPPIPPSISLFQESTLRMRWPKYWSFSFSIILSKEHPGLISFRMDWLDLLAVQETFKSLLQRHRSKVSILQCSAFFTVQLSHPYMTIAWVLIREIKGSHDLSSSSWWVGFRNPSLLAKSQVNLCWLYLLVQRKATASFATEPRSQGIEALAHDGSLKSREAKKQKPALWMPRSFVLFSFSSPFPSPRRPWMLSLKEHNNTS